MLTIFKKTARFLRRIYAFQLILPFWWWTGEAVSQACLFCQWHLSKFEWTRSHQQTGSIVSGTDLALESLVKYEPPKCNRICSDRVTITPLKWWAVTGCGIKLCICFWCLTGSRAQVSIVSNNWAVNDSTTCPHSFALLANSRWWCCLFNMQSFYDVAFGSLFSPPRVISFKLFCR